MRERDRVARFLENAEKHRERLVTGDLVIAVRDAIEDGTERFAFHKPGRAKQFHLFVESEIVNRQDARVLQLAGQLRFANEAQNLFTVGLVIGLQSFQCDVPHERGVMQLSVQRARRQQTSSKRTAWRIFGILFILVGAIAALLILQYAMNELTSRDPGGKRRTEAGESAARNF